MKQGATRSLAGRALRVAFGVAGIVFVVIAFRHTWNRSRTVVLPPAWRLVAAEALIMAGLLSSALAWSRLFGRRVDRALMRAFLLSQPAKYIPGGAWQIVGQVGLSHQTGVALDRAVAAFPVWVAIQVAATGTAGAFLSITSGIDARVRGLSLLGLLTLGLLHRGWLVGLTRLYAKWRKKAMGEDVVPAQRAILVATAWTLLTVAATGAGFGLLLSSLHGRGIVAAIPIFSLSWVAGFLVIPVPGGLGVREAVMLALAGAAGGATIAASVLQRLLAIAAEALLALLSLRRSRSAPRPAPEVTDRA